MVLPLQNTGCLKTSLSEMSSESIWGVMLKSIWQSVIKPPSGRRSVCVCVNIYTLDSHHVERMCSVKICKLICQSDQRGKKKKNGSGTRNTHTHTHTERPTGAWPSIPIEISHSQTGCGPKVGGFALETVPAAIFGP